MNKLKKAMFLLPLTALLFGCKKIKDVTTTKDNTTSDTTTTKNNDNTDTPVVSFDYTITYHIEDGENNPNNPAGFMKGDKIELFAPSKEHHDFIGWYTNPAFAGAIVTSIDIDTDYDLYAKFEPTQYEITYVNVDGLDNPNPSSYTYYSDNITLQSVNKPLYDFINWYTTSTFTDGTEISVIDTSKLVPVTVYAKFEYIKTYPTIDIEANNLTYNGEDQKLVSATVEYGEILYRLNDSTEYSSTIPTGKHAGEYVVYYKVIGDSEHLDIDEQSITVTINEADITDVEIEGYNGTYDSNEHNVYTSKNAKTVDNSDATWSFRKVGELTWQSELKVTNPSDSGTYEFKITAENHKEYSSTFDVLIKDIPEISITNKSQLSKVYDGKNIVDVEISCTSNGEIVISYSNDGGNTFTDEKPKNAGTYIIMVESLESDTFIYGYINEEITISNANIINPVVIGYTGIVDDDNHIVFESRNAKTVDNSSISWLFRKEGTTDWIGELYVKETTDSGTYEFKASADNHNDATGTFTVVITDKSIPSISITNLTQLSKVYDEDAIVVPNVTSDSAGIITISYSSDDGYSYSTNRPVNAGNYIIKVEVEETSDYSYGYILESFTITPASIDTKSISLPDKTFTYNGSTRSLVYSGTLPEKISDVKYTNNDQTDAGIYTVTLSFVYDEKNYTLTVPTVTGKLTIEKAVIDLNAIVFEDKTFTYDGSQKSIYVDESTLPSAIEEVNYDNNGKTTAGSYTVTATFNYDTKNYTTVGNVNATLTIEQETPSYTIPTNLKVEANKTLQTVTLPTGFSFMDSSINVGNELGNRVFLIKYTPTDTVNYKTVNNIEVTIKVQARYVIECENNQEATYDTNTHGPVVTIKLNGEIVTNNITVTYSYSPTTSSYITGLPTNAGTYNIKITCVGTEGFDANDVIVQYTINKCKVKFVSSNIEANYNPNIRTWQDHKTYLEERLLFCDLNDVVMPISGNILGINNGYYYYGEVVSGLKTIDTVAGSVYKVSVGFESGNYEIVGNKYFMYTYRTAYVNSKYYTIEEALQQSGDITLAGSINSTTSYVVTSTCNLDDDLYPYSTRDFSFSKTLYIPYTNLGTTDHTLVKSTTPDSTIVCSALVVTPNTSIEFGGTVNVCAKVVGNGYVCNHGVLYNDGNITFKSGSKLIAYGFVKGTGIVTCLDGSTCQDVMALWDYGSASQLADVNSAGSWPITIWTIHSISCKLKLYNGSIYNVYTSIYGWSVGTADTTATIIGNTSTTNCMFKPSNNSASSYILKYTKENTNILSITGSNQEQGQIDIIEIHGDYQDGTLSITLMSNTVESSTTKAVVIPYLSIEVKDNSTLQISKSSYVFGLGTYVKIDEGSKVIVNNGFIAFDKLTNGSHTIFQFFGSYCKNKVDSYIQVDGTLTGTGSVGGKITTTKHNSVLNVSKYSVSSIKTKNTNSPYYYQTTNYQAFGSIYNGSYADNQAFTNGKAYSSVINNSKYYFEEINSSNVNVFTINYYSDGALIKSQSITVVNETSYTVTGNEFSATKDYYDFVEWLDSNNNPLGYNGNNILTTTNSSINLYASYVLKNYHLSYTVKCNGIDISNDVTYENLVDTFTIDSFISNKLAITTTASYNGLNFDGWYLGIDKSTNIKLTEITRSQFNKFVETLHMDTIPFYGEFSDVEYYTIGIVDATNNTITAAYSIPYGTSLNSNNITINYDPASYNNDYAFASYITGFKNGTNTFTIDEILEYNVTGNIAFTVQWANKNVITLTNYNDEIESTIYCIQNNSIQLPSGNSYYDFKSSGATETSGYYYDYIFDHWNTTLVNGLYTSTGNATIKAIYNTESYYLLTFSISQSKVTISGSGIISGAGTKADGSTAKIKQNGKVVITFSYNTTADGAKNSAKLNGSNATSGTEYTITKNSKFVIESIPPSCLVEGTLITMADGTLKPVEEIVQGDLLLVFNHETGDYDVSFVLFNDAEELRECEIINLEFSNGKAVKVVSEHGFFDMDLNKYVYITSLNYQDFIGHRFYSMDDEVVLLTNAYLTYEEVRVYSPVTAFELNYFTEGMLSMPGGIPGLFNIFEYDDNLKYDEELMQEDINTYGLFTYDDFADYIPEEIYEVFNGKYLKVAIAKGLLSFDDILYYVERYSIYW